MVPVAWTSIWIAALCLLATWSAVTWLAARSVGLDTPRPPTPTIEYGPEPIRDARGRWTAGRRAGRRRRSRADLSDAPAGLMGRTSDSPTLSG